MSLNYEYYGTNWESFDKEDRAAYHNLPWWLLAADVGYLNEDSVDEVVERADLLGWTIKETNDGVEKERALKKEDLEKFYGLRTNVETLTRREWALKRFVNNYASANNAWKKKLLAAELKDAAEYRASGREAAARKEYEKNKAKKEAAKS